MAAIWQDSSASAADRLKLASGHSIGHNSFLGGNQQIP